MEDVGWIDGQRMDGGCRMDGWMDVQMGGCRMDGWMGG